jgi:hypothetical protein
LKLYLAFSKLYLKVSKVYLGLSKLYLMFSKVYRGFLELPRTFGTVNRQKRKEKTMARKITIEGRVFQKLRQIKNFILNYAWYFKPETPAGDAAAAVVAAVAKVSEQTASQGSLENRLRELMRAAATARMILRAQMERLYRTAAAIAVAGDPGFDDKFKMPLTGDAKLMNAARSALQDAAPHAEIFIRHLVPADFLDALKVALDNFEAAREAYARTRSIVDSGRRGLKLALNEANAAARRCDAIVRNMLEGDPLMLAAWDAAYTVPRKKPEASETPAPPAAGEPAPGLL